MSLLQVTDLSFGYNGGAAVLSAVSFALARGERLALLGPNGAGKSTLVWHLVGLLGGLDGCIAVAGEPLTRANLGQVRQRIGLVFQHPDDQLFCPTVYDDVAFSKRAAGVPEAEVRAAVTGALARVHYGGPTDVYASRLSSGERRRVAIASVLISEPELLALDEPTSHLDPRGRRELAELLGGLEQTLLVVTHELEWAAGICERGLILDGGRVVADAPLSELLDDGALLERHGLS